MPGLLFPVLFTVAMGLHFVLTNRGLSEHYPARFRARGRILLAVSLLVGWALAAVAAPTSVVLVALLAAFLGGSVLLEVFKEESLALATPALGGSRRAWCSTRLFWCSSPPSRIDPRAA